MHPQPDGTSGEATEFKSTLDSSQSLLVFLRTSAPRFFHRSWILSSCSAPSQDSSLSTRSRSPCKPALMPNASNHALVLSTLKPCSNSWLRVGVSTSDVWVRAFAGYVSPSADHATSTVVITVKFFANHHCRKISDLELCPTLLYRDHAALVVVHHLEELAEHCPYPWLFSETLVAKLVIKQIFVARAFVARALYGKGHPAVSHRRHGRHVRVLAAAY